MSKTLESSVSTSETISEECPYTREELDQSFSVKEFKNAFRKRKIKLRWVISIEVLTGNMREEIVSKKPPWEYVKDVLVPICEKARKAVSTMKYDELKKIKEGKGDVSYFEELDKTLYKLTIRKIVLLNYVAGLPFPPVADLDSKGAKQYREYVQLERLAKGEIELTKGEIDEVMKTVKPKKRD